MKLNLKLLAALCVSVLAAVACVKTEKNVEELPGEEVVLSLCPSGEILEVADEPLSKAGLPDGTLYVVSVYQGAEKYAHGVFSDPSQMSIRLSTGKAFSIQVKAVKAGVREISHEGAVYSGNGTLDNAFHYYASDTTDGTLYGNTSNIASLEDQWLLDTYYGALTVTPTAQTDNVNIMLYHMMHKVTVAVVGFENSDGSIAFTQSPYLPGTAAFTLSPSYAEYSKYAVINTDFSAVVSAITGTEDYSRSIAFTAEYSSTVSGEPYVKKLLDSKSITFRRNRETRITLTLSHNYLGNVTATITLTVEGEDMGVDENDFDGTIDSDASASVSIPEAVDLGLSVKWASSNLCEDGLCANSEDYGDYYAWGETGTNSNSSWSTYKWCNGSNHSLTKYNTDSSYGDVDNKMVLEPEDDVAHVKLGGNWRMPSDVEWAELRENCTWTWIIQNGVNGYLVKSKTNSNSIFLPATYSTYAFYWSSTLDSYYPDHAMFVILDSDYDVVGPWYDDPRYLGRSVRPVLSPAVESISINKSALSLPAGETEQLAATVLPSEATGLIVSWKSLNTSVATVSENGLVTAISGGTATIIASAGSRQAVCIVTVTASASVSIPEAVDLGLSVKWASFNLGASKPEEYGDYYAWGETEPYYLPGHAYDSPCNDWKDGKTEGYEWPSYKWSNSSGTILTKYCPRGNTSSWGGDGNPDNKVVLDWEDDAAHVKLGGSWRMPTKYECNELKKQCTWTWTDDYKGTGLSGCIITSNKAGFTDKSIFLPAAGTRHVKGIEEICLRGSYWSSSIEPGSPRFIDFLSFESDLSDFLIYDNLCIRSYGHTIRPIYGDFIQVTGVSLNRSSLVVSNEYPLTATVTPSNASNRALNWSSSDTSIATVNGNGLVTAVGPGTTTITVETYDGGLTASCTVTVSAPTPDGAVDLGLSVYWADCNLGASTDSGYGKYYYFNGWTYDLSKKGSSWRMPTIAELDELKTLSHEWTSKDGVNGMSFVNSSTGESIFLPAGGYGYDSANGIYYDDKGSAGYYWSSSASPTNGASQAFQFTSTSFPSTTADNSYSLSVRPVYPKAD